MSATLVYAGIFSVLAIGVAILTVAVLLLRTARRYVDLAERRLELLREGQALLLKVARQQGHVSEEGWQQERSERIPEVVGHPLVQGTGGESPGNLTPPDEPDRHAQEAPVRRWQASFARDGEQGQEPALEPSAQAGSASSRPKDGAPRLGVRVAHPDDEVTPRVWNSSATKYFQKCYDRYLEQYEGYVRLAERIYRMQDEARANPGTLGSLEWEDKLRRAHDAIGRTTQRLDLLEEHYPELATDSDRISARVSTSRLHAGLAKRFGSSR